MGCVNKNLSLQGFYKALGMNFLRFPIFSFDYIDAVRFYKLMEAYREDKKRIKVPEVLSELESRMSEDYFRKVFLAQTQVMYYASVGYPTYSLIMAEDLAEDWLATVDFHKKFARDHSLHQPLTAYVVAELLGYGNPKLALKIPGHSNDLLTFCTNSIFDKGDYLLDYARDIGIPERLLEGDNLSRRYWMDLFYQTAILSALFHDMGYPWQYLERIGYTLGKSANALNPSIASLPLIMERYKDRLVLLPFRQYHKPRHGQPSFVLKEMEEKVMKAMVQTHGLPGGIAFLELNDKIRVYPPMLPSIARHDFSIEWAAMGIVMHDMVSQHKDDGTLCIDFSKDPLSSIVTLADYLEEFQRPNVEFVNSAYNSRIKYGYACKEVKLSIVEHTLSVKMKYKQKSFLATANHFKREETEEYFGGESPYLDLNSIGISEVVFRAFS